MTTTETLFDAVRTGDTATLGAMLAQEPDLAGARLEDGATLLITALYHGAEDAASLLLAHGASMNIFEATAAGNLSRVTELLDTDPAMLGARSHDGWTPLHLAGFFGQPEVAKLLLARGADAAAISSNTTRNLPLHAAIAGKRNHDVIRMLLEHTPDVNFLAEGGYTPLHLAASRGDIELITLLLERGGDRTIRMTNGQTAADLALERNHPDAAQLLQP